MGHDELERRRAGQKEKFRVAPQEACDATLRIRQASGTGGGREGFGEVEVQPDIEVRLMHQARGPFRVRHEDHEAARRNAPGLETPQSRVSFGG